MWGSRARNWAFALGGGHTEITQGFDRSIPVGQMLSEVAPARQVRKTRSAIGDQIRLAQGIAIDCDPGTRESRMAAVSDGRRCSGWGPGISVVNAALAAANVGEAVHAMHHPTEGGLATGLFELGAVVAPDKADSVLKGHRSHRRSCGSDR